MTSPIDPKVDPKTGRLMTEWFEFPEYDEETIIKEALDELKVTKRPEGWLGDMSPEERELAHAINGIVGRRRKVKWRGYMTQQEVGHRMNEASKMVNPDNYKFLPDDVRERTGLEVNPLWMMECLVRSGVLTPKEQIQALKELAAYSHSKAPSLNTNTNLNVNAEDWLLELAKEEYKVIDDTEHAEVVQPKTPVERGAGKQWENMQHKRIQETQALENHASQSMAELMAEVDEEWEEDDS